MTTRGLGSPPNPNADPNAKDKFKNLDSDFKDAIAQSSPEEVRKRIVDLCAELEAQEKAQKDDQDLVSKKEAVATAMEPYREAKKDLKLRVKFCLRVLGDQGKL